VIDDKVLVEVKSVEKMKKINEAQLMTYLRLSGLRVGLIINFNVTMLKDGITRRVI
jgi:GxxExxY protein